MKRTLIAMIAIVGMATTANAATLGVVSDQSMYNVSDTVTLTVTGDAEGASTLAVLVTLTFGGSGAVSFISGTQNQNTSFSGGLPWTAQPLTGDGSAAVAISQLAGTNPLVPDDIFVSTIVLRADGPGQVDVGYLLATHDFFGTADGVGTSFTIVPEPTTAGLLGLGLLSLAVAGRRR